MDLIRKLSLIGEPHLEEEPCKGLYFRGKVNEYVDSGGFYRRDERLVRLKRKSCSGCEYCDWMFEDFSSHLEGGLEIPKIEHGKMYELQVVASYRNWETGICDDVTLGYVKVEEKQSAISN